MSCRCTHPTNCWFQAVTAVTSLQNVMHSVAVTLIVFTLGDLSYANESHINGGIAKTVLKRGDAHIYI